MNRSSHRVIAALVIAGAAVVGFGAAQLGSAEETVAGGEMRQANVTLEKMAPPRVGTTSVPALRIPTPTPTPAPTPRQTGPGITIGDPPVNGGDSTPPTNGNNGNNNGGDNGGDEFGPSEGGN